MSEIDDVLFGGDMPTLPTDGIRQMAEDLQALGWTIAAKEQELKDLRAAAQRLEFHSIPEAMATLGVTELSAKWGEIKVQPFWSGTIKPENADAAHKWMDENGLGEFIKRAVEVPVERGNEEDLGAVRYALERAGILFSEQCGVHHQTLQAMIKRQAMQGKPVPADLFSVYSGSRAKIKLA